MTKHLDINAKCLMITDYIASLYVFSNNKGMIKMLITISSLFIYE